MTLVGQRFKSGNYGPLIVYRDASLTDRYRIVGLLVTEGKWAGVRLGIPEHQLGTHFPKVAA